MNKEDAFKYLDEILFARGRRPRIDASAIPGGLGLLIRQFERRSDMVLRHINHQIPLKRRREVHTCFCEEETYGAFALSEGYDYVILKIGIVATLMHFCQCMMATPGLWVDVGMAVADVPNQERSAMLNIVAHSAWRALPQRISDDRTRMALGVTFMAECFDFIVFHEMAHIVLDHTRRRSDFDDLAFQALELVSDGHAAVWGVQKVLLFKDGMLGRYPEGADLGYRAFHRSPDDAMLNYLLVMFFVFRLMDETFWSVDKLANRKHPPAPVRFHAACLQVGSYFQSAEDNETRDRFRKAMAQVWASGETIFSETLGRVPCGDLKERTLSEENEQYYNLLCNRMEGFPPELLGVGEL